MRDNRVSPTLSKEWNYLIQIARLGLLGKTVDLQNYLRRILPTFPVEVSKEAQALLADSRITNRALKGKSISPPPVDADSRLSLLKIIPNPSPARRLFFSKELAGQLNQFVAERKSSEKLLTAGILPPASLLFSGPPGVGKTRGAELVASKLELPLLTLDLSAMMSSYLGKTGQNIRVVLDYAKSFPSVLFLDEFDSIAKSRDSGEENGELRRLVNVLLQEINEWPIEGVLIAATNHPESLDYAIWRRFNHVVKFECPDKQVILEMLSDRIDGEKDATSLNVIAGMLGGFSHSEIDNLIANAVRRSVMNEKSVIVSLLETTCVAGQSKPKESKVRLARALRDLNYSLREIEEYTQVTKSTLHRWLK